MSAFEKVLLIVSYFIGCNMCIFCMFITRLYHSSKPLGLQTILGKVIVIASDVTICATIYFFFTFSLLEIYGPFPKLIAILITMILKILTSMFYSGIIAILVTKYLSIYYSVTLEDIGENLFCLIVKVMIVLISVNANVLEDGCRRDFESLAMFQMFYNPDNLKTSGLTYTGSTLMGLALLFGIILQTR